MSERVKEWVCPGGGGRGKGQVPPCGQGRLTDLGRGLRQAGGGGSQGGGGGGDGLPLVHLRQRRREGVRADGKGTKRKGGPVVGPLGQEGQAREETPASWTEGGGWAVARRAARHTKSKWQWRLQGRGQGPPGALGTER